jgi:hypothetical protein
MEHQQAREERTEILEKLVIRIRLAFLPQIIRMKTANITNDAT